MKSIQIADFRSLGCKSVLAAALVLGALLWTSRPSFGQTGEYGGPPYGGLAGEGPLKILTPITDGGAAPNGEQPIYTNISCDGLEYNLTGVDGDPNANYVYAMINGDYDDPVDSIYLEDYLYQCGAQISHDSVSGPWSCNNPSHAFELSRGYNEIEVFDDDTENGQNWDFICEYWPDGPIVILSVSRLPCPNPVDQGGLPGQPGGSPATGVSFSIQYCCLPGGNGSYAGQEDNRARNPGLAGAFCTDVGVLQGNWGTSDWQTSIQVNGNCGSMAAPDEHSVNCTQVSGCVTTLNNEWDLQQMGVLGWQDTFLIFSDNTQFSWAGNGPGGFGTTVTTTIGGFASVGANALCVIVNQVNANGAYTCP